MKKHPRNLQEWFDYEIQNLATVLRPTTILLYQLAAKSFLSHLHAQWPNVRRPSHLRRDPHILGWLRSLCERQPPLANKTRTERIINVRRLIRDLETSSDPPCEDLFAPGDCPAPNRYLPKPLSPEDDRRLQQRLLERQTLRSKALWILRATGMRIGECRMLAADSLRNLGQDQWAVRVPLGKLHTERWVPVDDHTRGIFNSILDQRPSNPDMRDARNPGFLLLQKNGRPPSYMSMRKELILAAHEAGCSVQPTLHQMRHTYATEMLRAGVSLPAVKTLLGHQTLEMTMRYVQISQIDLQREYHRARAKMAEIHAVPGMPKTLAPDLTSLHGLLTEAAHVMEMHRREMSDVKKNRHLARLVNRIAKILAEFKLAQGSIK
jgi:site-specific recombinase XerD